MNRPRPSELCQLSAAWKGDTPSGGMWAEPKIDGWRALWIKGAVYTRNGLPIGGVSHITHRLALMEKAAGQPMFFDGELQIGGTLKATKEHCERGYKLGDAGTLHLFDCLTRREWEANDCDRPLHERNAMLADLVERSKPDAWEWREGTRGREPDGPATSLVPSHWFTDSAHVWQEAKATWAAGNEGFVLKDHATPYRRNRCQSWQKVKQEGHHLRWTA